MTMRERLRRAAVYIALVTAFFASPVSAEEARPATDSRAAWVSVAGPAIASVEPKAGDPATLVVSFTLEIGPDGADRATVEMADASDGSTNGAVETKAVGRSKRAIKTAEFSPQKSGTYSFTVRAARAGETDKTSAMFEREFSFPLAQPVVRALSAGILDDGALNERRGSLRVAWDGVREATGYVVECALAADANKTGSQDQARISVGADTLETSFTNLVVGSKYSITVTAVRGDGSLERDRAASAPYAKLVKGEIEREWKFTWFGQSSSAALNTMEMIDADNLTFRLNSCAFDPKTQATVSKGGKFTAFHDGISYYYAEIDPDRENFSLTATFTVDYINPTADGQEGFGLIAMDSLGEYGVNSKNHYTNSASIIATKYEATVGGSKKTSKDTLGARFVSGLTRDVLSSGDSAIAANGTCVANAFSYDQGDLVSTGDSYTLTLKKTNTGYHAIYAKQYAAEDAVTEYVMYGPDKLRALDGDKVYVGFAVARGCNVTVSGVTMIVTDPATDPPADTEPAELVPLVAVVDSPSTFTESEYPFVFYTNVDGLVTVTDENGKAVIKDATVTHGVDFARTITLARGINDFNVSFAPDPEFVPGARKAIARYDGELKRYVPSLAPINIMHTVIRLSYDVSELRAAPNGSPLGKGTAADPLDLASAINYARPGQPIILASGTYYPERGIIVERGNSGTEAARKILRSAPGGRAILDFGSSSGGFVLAGDWWTVDGIDIRNTSGNVKGLQISGDHCIVSNVHAYRCGDTGIQISGSSEELPEKWPHGNLVVSCVSHDNCDPAENNADGFAAKLTCGEGNVFRSCLAYSNIDDGWDLFSKIETGPIGAVVIENCVAWKNGSLSDGSGNGDGNGFKLGGDGIAVAHVLRNSVAFSNGASGITSNSDPAVILENVTSYGNAGANVSLYGKGDGSRLFKAAGVISMAGGIADNIREMPELASALNWFWNGAKCVNPEGGELKADSFLSIDLSRVPSIRDDGSVDMGGLLYPGDSAPVAAGARIR